MQNIWAVTLFVLAGFAEIGGGYLVWLWLREDWAFPMGVLGAVVLIAYGVIPTFQPEGTFGRIYAAYGGWPRSCEGAAICPVGVSVIMWAQR